MYEIIIVLSTILFITVVTVCVLYILCNFCKKLNNYNPENIV